MLRLHRQTTWCSAVFAALLALVVPAASAAASATPPIARTAGAARLAAGGSNYYFNSDSCTGRTFCMAVGAYNLGGHTPGLSEVLSRGSWLPEPVASPSRGINIFANEVSCASPTNCLFVGEHWAGRNGPVANLAEAWNGSSWRIVTAAGPVRTAFSGLDDVACPTRRFCLAVGFAGRANSYQDTAYTWVNGSAWRQIRVPSPRGARNSQLGGLACFSSGSCMAVGNYTSQSRHILAFAVSWHRGRWQLLTTPAIRGQRYTIFQGVSCPAANLCAAVGNTVDNTRSQYYHAFAEVWNGDRWHLSMLGRPGSFLLGVSCPASNRCFASGYAFPTLAGFAHGLIETWNGRTWRAQHAVETSAPYSGDVFEHVSCVIRSECEAVGYRFELNSQGKTLTLAEMWNGHRWALQTTANP